MVAISTGIGCPSTAIVVEELRRIGVKTMIRVGTCGLLTDKIGVGGQVIADRAYRLDGTSRQYVADDFPLVVPASERVTNALKESAKLVGSGFGVGAVASVDAFYSEEKGLKMLEGSDAVCVEMESSVLFTLGKIYGLDTGAVFAAVDRIGGEFKPSAGIDEAIEIAIGAVRKL